MIRVEKVRVISETGQQLGIMTPSEAIQLAQTQGLDLVEVSPDAVPPVCKIINFGKYKYEISKKAKESKKHQKVSVLKEIKIGPKIGEHDLLIKINHARKFIEAGHKVKISINFKGRQITHTEFGTQIVNTILKKLEDVVHVETAARMDGPNMYMTLISKVSK